MESSNKQVKIYNFSWSTLWRTLRASGWSWDFGNCPGESIYFKPGYNKCSIPKAVMGVEMFANEESVHKYVMENNINKTTCQLQNETELVSNLTVSCSSITMPNEFHKTIAFPDHDQEFVMLESTNRGRSVNTDLLPLCSIGFKFSDSMESGRKDLYCQFMNEIQKLLQNNSNTFISYNDWIACFNDIYSHILTSKLKNNSIYMRGTEEVIGFRSKKFRKSDNTAIIMFYNLQKENAERDVREIMKILNMVLNDSRKLSYSGELNSKSVVSDNLTCFEDYSAVYKNSSEFCKLDSLVKGIYNSNSESNTHSLINLNHLLGATESDAIIMTLQKSSNSDDNSRIVSQYT